MSSGQLAVKLVRSRARISLPRGQLRRRGDLELGLIHVVEESEELVILALEIGSYLWSWHWAQPTVRPRKTVPVVLTRSTIDSTRNCSTSIPPSWLISVLRWNPVAIRWAEACAGTEVAGELLDREPVERHVAR